MYKRQVTGSKRRCRFLIQQGKQIGFVHHVEKIGLVLFLFLVDGRIVVDHNIEGVAGLGLYCDELLIRRLVIEQIAGISVAFTFNRLALIRFRLFGCCGFRCRLGLGRLRDRKLLLGVIRIGECGYSERDTKR